MQAQVPIKANKIFGQNGWFIDFTDPIPQDFLWPLAASSGVKYIRIGGIEACFHPLYSFNFGTQAITNVTNLKHVIDQIRLAGMEPILQVGYNPVCAFEAPFLNMTSANQAIVAANIVDRINNVEYTDTTPGLPDSKIEYWIIANEPDLQLNCISTDLKGFGYNQQTDANLISTYIKDFATKMKDKDPNIKIIGPELTKFGNDNGIDGGGNYYNPSNKIMDDLISPASNSNSIMGQISAGNGINKYFIDVLSFHYYPDSISSKQNVVDDPTNQNGGFHYRITSNAAFFYCIS